MSKQQVVTKAPDPVAPAPQANTLRAELDRMAPQFRMALPAHIKPDQFIRTVLTAVNQTPALTSADRRSLFAACMKAAQDGLLPDGREGAIVTFGNQASWMPMVFGLMKKLRQSGEIASITARIVYENELGQGRFTFIIDEGAERLKHEPMLSGDRGKAALVYATARFKDGTVQNEVLTVADVEKVRQASKSKNGGPWTQWWEEMARKTAIRRLSKYLPLSAEDRRAVDREAEDTEFQELKRDAIAAAPQSIDAARMLGAPEEPPHDATTGEIVEPPAEIMDAEYTPGSEG